MANAIAGTVVLIGLAGLLGVPLGVLGGLYMAEYPNARLTTLARFTADVMNGVPSIVMGLFAYVLVVLPLRHFSALSGGVALGVMLVPTVMRTTEEIVRLVPQSFREASLALGIPQWKTILRVVVPTAAAGIVTGIMVGMARIAGETAPLQQGDDRRGEALHRLLGARPQLDAGEDRDGEQIGLGGDRVGPCEGDLEHRASNPRAGSGRQV